MAGPGAAEAAMEADLVRSLSRMVEEQQEQISILQRRSKQLVVAHFGLRDLHQELYDQHFALCDCLYRGGILEPADLELRAACYNAYRQSDRPEAGQSDATSPAGGSQNRDAGSLLEGDCTANEFQHQALQTPFQAEQGDPIFPADGIQNRGAGPVLEGDCTSNACQHQAMRTPFQATLDGPADRRRCMPGDLQHQSRGIMFQDMLEDSAFRDSAFRDMLVCALGAASARRLQAASRGCHGRAPGAPFRQVAIPAAAPWPASSSHLPGGGPHPGCSEVDHTHGQFVAAQELRPGQLVCLAGLRSRPELNGVSGTLVSYDPSTRKCHVVLSTGEAVRVPLSCVGHAAQAGGRHQKPEQMQPCTLSTLPTEGALQRVADFAGLQATASLEFVCRPMLTTLAALKRIYVCGGGNPEAALSSMEYFDPVAWRWRSLPAMAQSLQASASAVFARQLYVFGGSDGDFRPMDCAARFDPEVPAWEVLPPMIRPRNLASAAVLDGRLYVCGGLTATGSALSSAERFDPIRLAWQMLPTMLQPRSNAFAVALRGRLYLCGGDDSGALRHVECFDPLATAWEPAPPMSERRIFAGAALLRQRLYFCGGMGGGPDAGDCSLRSAERFDPSSQRWEVLPPMLQPRHGASTAAVGGTSLLVCGGAMATQGRAHQIMDSVEFFNGPTGTWELAQRMLHCRAFAVAAVVADHLYICGGYTGDGRATLDSAERLSLVSGEWEPLPAMSVSRSLAVGGCLPLRPALTRV